ncbi:unnamed protein product [Phaeothamnion confervicola]
MEGHSATVAYSGEAAIEAYEKQQFDLAFMDVMMPGKNGVESFLEIRKKAPTAKVYMMTGYSVDQLLQQAMDNGALGIFAKPVDLDKVLNSIASIVPNGIVLVAEDDPDFGPALLDSIRSTGRSCELVSNGEQAIARVEQGSVEVLILDLNLPLIDGIEVYTLLRSAGHAPPTVMITGCLADYQEALAAFGDIETTGILTKPFDFDELHMKLHRLAA